MTKIMMRGLLTMVAATVICAAVTTTHSFAHIERQGMNNSHILSLAEGKESSFLVTKDGSLWGIGKNDRGQLGTGDLEAHEQFQKILEDVMHVSAGYEHTAAIKENGQLYVWGSNEEGQIGNGGGKDVLNPQLVLENAVQAAAGGYHTLAVKEDGSLWAWGSNASGALGTGSGKTIASPAQVMDNVREAGAGWYFSAAVREDGSLWTWGWNEKGRLGTGDTKDYKNPVHILDDVTSIAIGPSHALALKEDGSLWAWGDNGYGQLGDGTKEHRYKPVKVMDDIVSISAGYYSSAAIKADGSLWTWGTNKGLWLGSESKEPSTRPIEVKQNVSAVALGRAGSLTVTKDSSIHMDSLTSNQTVRVEDGRPVVVDDILTVLNHNQNVYHAKRSDAHALDYYLQATDMIQSDHPTIQALAKEITSEAQSDEEKLKAIHDWVCRNIYYNYDAYYNGASKGDISALGALSEEATICSGYSNLTAALLRASGIPAKYVSGYATTRGSAEMTTADVSESRNAHAWNEAYINGRWVILDTTWNSNNRYQDGQRTGMPFGREFFDTDLAKLSMTHMIKEYTEFTI